MWHAAGSVTGCYRTSRAMRSAPKRHEQVDNDGKRDFAGAIMSEDRSPAECSQQQLALRSLKNQRRQMEREQL